MIENPNAPFMFVVDTDQYAGNFERPMTAYMTGRYGECGVGAPEAKLFYQEMGLKDGLDKKFSDYEEDDWKGISLQYSYEDFQNPFIFVIELPDEHGCARPTTIYPAHGWFNNGLGGHFREGEEEKALSEYRQKCLERAERPGDKERWTDKAKGSLQKYPAYQSVAIFMSRKPTEEEIAILKERAHKFADYSKNHPNEFNRHEIAIEGFRLVKIEVKETGTAV